MQSGAQAQFIGSVLKLLNYSLFLTEEFVRVEIPNVFQNRSIPNSILKTNGIFYNSQENRFFLEYAPVRCTLSPTIYRIDDCHGAGKCCMVPFDLIYTKFSWAKVVEYSDSGEPYASANRFLLDNHREVEITVNGHPVTIYYLINDKIMPWSEKTSCPLLKFNGEWARFMCTAHFFKPLHCWYPHMVVRRSEAKRSAFIGTMQYGRNHKFGCPVIFKDGTIQEYIDSGQHELNKNKMGCMIETSNDLGVKTAHPRLMAEMCEFTQRRSAAKEPVNLFTNEA